MNNKFLQLKNNLSILNPTIGFALLFTVGITNVFGRNHTNCNNSKVLSNDQFSNKQHSKEGLSPLGTTNNLYVTLFKSITGTTDYAQADQIKLLVASTVKVNGSGSNKLLNGSDNLAFIEGTKVLAIDGYNTVTNKDTITVAVTQLTTSLPYKLKVDATAFSVSGFVPMLLDRFTNNITALVADTALISFTPTAATNTFGNRFAIVFKATGLPVQEISLTATQLNKDILINWNTIGESDLVSYTIESATSLSNFNEVATVNANNKSNGSYSYSDINSSAIYYRIKATDLSGVVSYSKVIIVSRNVTAKITAFPNPLVGNTLHLSTSNLSAGKYNVVLKNTIGQNVFTSEIDGTNNNHNLKIGSLTAGQYILTIKKDGYTVYNSLIQIK